MEQLKEYIVPLDKSDILLLEQRVAKHGIDDVLNYQFRFLDCSRTISTVNGTIRAIQTIDYTYADNITQTLYLLNEYLPDREDLYNKLLELHNANLSFEKDNPPTWYSKKRWTKKTKDKNEVKVKRVKSNIRETAKQIKLSSLTLKLKPK